MVNKKKNKETKKVSKKKIAFWVILGALLIVFLFGLWHQIKPLPENISMNGEIYYVEEENIEFLYDLVYFNEEGVLEAEQEIFDKILETIDNAENFIMLDFFLMKQSKKAYRNLSIELKDSLLKKKKENPEVIINFITDNYNIGYGSLESPDFNELEEGGVNVIFTDMRKLRDSNKFYSAFWRTFAEIFGRPESPCKYTIFKSNGRSFCFRSVLELINAKANHRKLIVADNAEGEVVVLMTSANPDGSGSMYSNVAIWFKNAVFLDIYKSEKSIAEFSGYTYDEIDFPEIEFNKNGSVSLQFVTEGKIRESLVKEINSLEQGNEIDIAMFLLTERKIITALEQASDRGVTIRLVLDPSKSLFGKDSKGVPNCAAALDLAKKENIEIRWFNSDRHEFHSKLVVIKKGDKIIFFIGSANLSKRNIGDYNLEADVKVELPITSNLSVKILNYFEDIFYNKNQNYTLHYETCKTSWFGYVEYRLGESTGFSAF
jgi:cardiolipin synthase A/B